MATTDEPTGATPVDSPPIIARCVSLTRRFESRGERVLALDDVDLDIAAGRLVAVVGPSGSGKSTLLAMLGCLDRPTAGQVVIGSRDVVGLGRRVRRAVRRREVATMLAEPADNLFLERSGVDNILTAARGRGTELTPDALEGVVTRLGIGPFVRRPCLSMSGGEQQRVALAAAIVGSPNLVLCDEPTGSLDSASAASLIAALRRAADSGSTLVVATHDRQVIEAADEVVHLQRGRRLG